MIATEVRGPWLEYECSDCGQDLKEYAPRDPDRLDTRIAELTSDPAKRLCMVCRKEDRPKLTVVRNPLSQDQAPTDVL